MALTRPSPALISQCSTIRTTTGRAGEVENTLDLQCKLNPVFEFHFQYVGVVKEYCMRDVWF